MSEPLYKRIDLFSPKQSYSVSPEDAKRVSTVRRSVAKRLGTSFYKLPDTWRVNPKIKDWLFENQAENFDVWWDPTKYIMNRRLINKLLRLPQKHFEIWWSKDLNIPLQDLVERAYDKFDLWWDPDKFDWEGYSHLLPSYCRQHFDKWWNPDKFNWDHMFTLAYNLNGIEFHKWWNINKITVKSYKAACRNLTLYCKDYFDIWWRKNIYEYSFENTQHLMLSYKHKFDYWWNPSKIPPEFWDYHSYYMAGIYSKEFEKWWDKRNFVYCENNIKLDNNNRPCGRHYLIRYCGKHFDLWWDKQRIRPNKINHELLKKYCQEHFDKWAAEMIIYELGNEI